MYLDENSGKIFEALLGTSNLNYHETFSEKRPHIITITKYHSLQDAAMVLEEQPSKVAEAVKLFLQGLGYTTVRSRVIGRAAVSLHGTPVKMAPRPQPSMLVDNPPDEEGAFGKHAQQPPTGDLIGGLAELMLKEPTK